MAGVTGMMMLKWAGALLALVVVAVALVLFVVSRVELQQAKEADARLRGSPHVESGGKNAVIFYSRSGNTALAADHVARRLGARLYRLEADDYALGLPGLVSALGDARQHEARVVGPAIDLRGVQTVYLGSPIWLYSPAPPIWEFARRQRFDGQDVVLFNTHNSTIDPRFIEEFKALVMAQGAKSFQHRFVTRGRMGQQISTEEMLEHIDTEWRLIE
jgi:hypothetical protein